MSLDYPNRADWLAKRNNPVAGKIAYVRMVWTQGTFVRKRKDPDENARLTKFANRCNAFYTERRARRRSA